MVLATCQAIQLDKNQTKSSKAISDNFEKSSTKDVKPKKTESAVTVSDYSPDLQKYIHRESNVSLQNVSEAWNQLSEKEQNYAYYMSQASWAGAKMVFHQVSYESPGIFLMLQSFFQGKNLTQLEDHLIKKGIKPEEFKEFCAYAAAFYSNMGNYHSFGAKKFIPEIGPGVFNLILQNHPLMNKTQSKEGALYKKMLDELYPQIQQEIFTIQKPYQNLGFPNKGGVTAYFGRNMDEKDLALVKEFLDAKKIDILNTRAFKKDNGQYVVTVGSIDKYASKKGIKFNNATFDVEYGEFGSYLAEANKYLEKAAKYAANENQRQMIREYIHSFTSGSIQQHKESQKAWVKDKHPNVETNMGWIEHYVDPQNMRAMFEGFVAIVDKKRSEQYENLVKEADEIVPKLPWDKQYEKEKFNAPDFTSLDVLTFAAESLPKGINIPNYSDIREQVGFKNVIFENNKPMNKSLWQRNEYVSQEESDYLNEHSKDAYKVQVAGHELFGHGSGKLLFAQNGKCPESKDPQTNETFSSCYKEGQNFQTLFGSFSSSFEECRADLSGLYLATQPAMYKTFNYTADDVQDLLWTNMMGEIQKGVLGLPIAYNFETKQWKQAHTQGAWVITQYIFQNQKSRILDIEIEDGQFKIELNKTLMESEGHQLLGELLNTMQVYKSTGAVEKAKQLYQQYSEVPEIYQQVNDIVKANKKPGYLREFPNVHVSSAETPSLKNNILNKFAQKNITQEEEGEKVSTEATSSEKDVEVVVKDANQEAKEEKKDDKKETKKEEKKEKKEVKKEPKKDETKKQETKKDDSPQVPKADPPKLEAFSEDISGLIYSWADRYPFSKQLYDQVLAEWAPHKKDLRVKDQDYKQPDKKSYNKKEEKADPSKKLKKPTDEEVKKIDNKTEEKLEKVVEEKYTKAKK